MITILNEDINSYSYTGPDFADDSIVLAHYDRGTDEVTLTKDGFYCGITTYEDFDATYWKVYKMSEIDKAIEDFNDQVKKLGGRIQPITRKKVDSVLSEYGKSIDDYLPGGFYDQLRKR